MKLALQLGLIPGATVKEKQQWALEHGVEGIEVSAGNYGPDELDQLVADFVDSPVPLSSICGNPTFDFLDPDPKKRQTSIQQCKQYLEVAGELGATGQIVPPIFGPPRIPDLSPYQDAITLEKNLLVEICHELGETARRAGCLLLLEPLNRYEQHLLRRQRDGVEIIERCGHDHVRLISDLFHMHIEETNTPQAIREVGMYIRHVHLADNTRLEPGTGDIDFAAAFRALMDVGFDGYMAFECGISPGDRGENLKASLEFVRNAIAKAAAMAA
ncbi:MAG: sugar phosphate isomerase/epimerase [Firmicutes bacterium]|nr:sugar phosphate isomerase/epimerase [Bacillota bacterium]